MNIELYIDVMIACMIRQITFEWDTPNNKFQTVLCMVWLVFSVAFPFIGLCLVLKNRSKLGDDEFQDAYGDLVADVELNKDGAEFNAFVFLIHRAGVAFTIVYL